MIGYSQIFEAQPRNWKPLEIDGEVPTSVRSIEAAETDQLWLLLISSNSIIEPTLTIQLLDRGLGR